MDVLIAARWCATVWWNDGQGRLTRSGRQLWYSRKHGLPVVDLDDDGQPDVFAASYDTDCRVWHNQGSGVFRSAPGAPQARLALGDHLDEEREP